MNLTRVKWYCPDDNAIKETVGLPLEEALDAARRLRQVGILTINLVDETAAVIFELDEAEAEFEPKAKTFLDRVLERVDKLCKSPHR